MDDLVTWLRAALVEEAEASRAAAEASPPPWVFGEIAVDGDQPGPIVVDANERRVAELMWWGLDALPAPVGGHIARWDPARVLAEVEAKRRLIEFYSLVHVGDRGWATAQFALQCLAQPYASRPGFRDEWRLT